MAPFVITPTSKYKPLRSYIPPSHIEQPAFSLWAGAGYKLYDNILYRIFPILFKYKIIAFAN